jgi:hypothetical protein
MIHSATLFFVSDKSLPAFIASGRTDGLWRQLARQLQPALVATDLLQHANRHNLLLAIDYFISPPAYQQSLHSPAYETLLRFRQNMAVFAIELGAFSFPPHPEVAEKSAVVEGAVR